MYCFPRAVAYLDSGKINVKGMVSAPPFVLLPFTTTPAASSSCLLGAINATMMDEAREACPSPARVGVAFLAPLPYAHAGAGKFRARAAC